MKLTKLAVAAILATGALTGCTKITQQDIGLKVSLMGDDKGGIEVVSPGRYIEWPNTDYVRFPTATINVVWTANHNEGSPTNQSISMQTINGLVVNADIGLSFHVNPNKVVDLYRKYRKGINEISDIYLRNIVRDAFNDVVSQMPVEEVYGEGKVEMMQKVTAMVRKEVAPYGIVVDKISILGHLRLPESVVQSIQAKVQAVQKAEMRKNELAEAAARKNIAKMDAESYKQAQIIKAEGDAQAMQKKAAVLRANPELLQLQAIEKWNGVAPEYMSNGSLVPFAKVGNAK